MEVPGVACNYTAHLFSIQAKCSLGDVAETRWRHRRAAAATLRSPRGGGKMPFEILIHACAVAAAEEAGVAYTALARWGAIPDTLMRTAEEADCDVIVVGSPASPGWPWPRSKYLARHVIARARQPVLVVAQPPLALSGAPLWSRLLVVHDSSPVADMAVEYAMMLADTVYLDTCVLRLGSRWRSDKAPCLRRATQASISPSMALTPPAMAGSAHEVVASWDGIATILEAAAECGCDGIVLGTDQGLSWQRLRYGHIARALMAATDLPLLVVNRFTAWRY